MATYVLLHGGAAGSWIWRDCAQLLRRDGHAVHTVTFTGFAERRHLISRDCTVETHVAEAQFLTTAPQLGLPVAAKGQWGVTAADGVLPDVGQRHAGCQKAESEVRLGHVQAPLLTRKGG